MRDSWSLGGCVFWIWILVATVASLSEDKSDRQFEYVNHGQGFQ